MNMKKKLIVVGCSKTAEVIADLLISDSEFDVCAFVVDKEYIVSKNVIGIDVFSVDECLKMFPPSQCNFIVGVGGNQLNKVRFSLYSRFLKYGYSPATYISSRASISRLATVGCHCFIMENVVAHAGCTIGDNVFIFPNAYLGHHTSIGQHSFIAGNTSIGGGARIGEFCYLGASSSVINAVELGTSTMMGMGPPAQKIPHRVLW